MIFPSKKIWRIRPQLSMHHIITCSSHVARPSSSRLFFDSLVAWSYCFCYSKNGIYLKYEVFQSPICNTILGQNEVSPSSSPQKTRLQRAASIFSQQETPLTHLLGGQLVDVSTYVLGKYFSPISRSGYSKPFWVIGITILGELLAKWPLNI